MKNITNNDSLWVKMAALFDGDRQINPVYAAIKISSIYILIGALWVLVSDRLLAVAVNDKEAITLISIFKGLIYVLVTGGVIFLLSFASLNKTKDAQNEMEKRLHEIKEVYSELAASEEFRIAIIEKMLNAFALHKIILDDSGLPCDYEYIDVNPAFEAFTGLKKSDIVGKRYRELIPKSEIEKTDWVGIYGKVATTGEPVSIESYTDAFDKWVIVNAYSPKQGYFITVFSDISDIKRSEVELKGKNEELTSLYQELTAKEEELRQQFNELSNHQEMLRVSEERFKLAVEGSNDIIWDIDLIKNKYYFSDRWFEMLGYKKEEGTFEFSDWVRLLHEDDKEQAKAAANDHIAGKTPIFSCEYRLMCKNGEYKWFHSRGKALFDNNGKPIRFAGSLSDIDDRKSYEIKLQDNYQELEATYEELYATQDELKKQYDELKVYQENLKKIAYHDHLTGLPNRQALYEELSSHLKGMPKEKKALIFVDSDNFKFINDTLGHSFGDQLIIAIGNRLSTLFRNQYSVYRLGGDEFIICCCGYQSLDQIIECAERVIQSFIVPFEIAGSTLYTTVSIGISTYPQDGIDPDGLMRSADIAMYSAKALGKNKYVFYNYSMQESVKERMQVEKHLRSALQNNEFMLYYQPQLDIKTGKITGFEALLRWNNAELGFVSPLKFIGIAEETHLIISIGEWVLRNACLFLKQLHITGHTDLMISVNISILQLIQEDFVDSVIQILEFIDLPPKYLELEITESILMESYQAISDKLYKLKDRGMKIALDDFGQGYSSLSYLKQLPIDTLKIDKTFIDSINSEKSNDSLTGTIVMIGRKMGLTILAEGVEYQEQLDYLTKHKCHKIQGYLISKPLPPDEAIKLYERWV